MRLWARCILVTALTGTTGLASALALASTSAPSADLPSLPVPTTAVPIPSVPVPTGVVPTATLPAPIAPTVPTSPPVSTAAAPPVPVPSVPATPVTSPVLARPASTTAAGTSQTATPRQAPEAPPKESSSRSDTPAPVAAATRATPTPSLGAAATSTFRRGSLGVRTKPRPILGRVRLERQATLKIRVRQLLPVCRPIGSYAVKARPGSTLLRFPRRIGETRLGVGIYDARVRLAGGKTVLHVVKRIQADERGVLHAVAVRERVACLTELAALAAAPVYAAAPGHRESRSSGTPGLHVKSASDQGVVREAAPVGHARPSPSLPSAGSALGAVLLGAVLLSLGLFLVASVPEDVYAGAAATAAIGRRRGTIALAGAIVLCAGVGVVIYSWLT
jgi:hypothetical protein